MHRIEILASKDEARSWVHLLPAGKFNGIDGRGPYLANDPAQIVKRTRSYHGKKQIVIDYEHQSINAANNGKPAPAAGWIVGMEARSDGVWGLVEWTEAAAKHLASREYRYLSPVFHHTQSGSVLHIDNAGLTNSPNLDQLTALARSEVVMKVEAYVEKVASAAKLLGLPDGSDEKAVLQKLQPLVDLAFEIASITGETPPVSANSATPDPSKFVPIGDFERVVAEANQLRQGVTETAAEAHVADHIRRGVVAPFMKDWAVSLCKVNKPAFDSFVEKTGPAFIGLFGQQTSAHSRSQTASKLDEGQAAICAKLGLSAEQFANARES
ncbi:phage protease [Phyllobacterium phragmitis]|nr:phage protease [Phyllobacterium phragmitis]